MILVHITDSHKMLVDGLCNVLVESELAKVIGISHTIAECRNALRFNEPDVLLLEPFNLPDGDGFEFCKEIHQTYPNIKILVLTMHDENSYVKRMLDIGVSGYMLKNCMPEEVVKGVEAVAKGESYLSNELSAYKKNANQNLSLTQREKELLKQIVEGYTNNEIADNLYLSVETIKTYRKHLIFKLGAKNSIHLVKIAYENKLI